MQLIPIFTNVTGIDVIVVDPNYNKLEAEAYIEQKVCEYSNNQNCEVNRQELPFANYTGFSYNVIDTNVNDIPDNLCVIQPATPELATDINARYMINSLVNDTTYQEGDPLIETRANRTMFHLNLIHLGNCAADGSQDVATQIQRSSAFATMTTALALGDTEFVRNPRDGEHRKYSFIANSEASHVASDVSERILMDLWKAETSDYLNRKKYCGSRGNVSDAKSREMNIMRVNRTQGWVPRCPYDEDRNRSRLNVTDSNLHLFMFGSPEEFVARQRRKRDGSMGPYQPVVPNPPYQYEPFKPFGSYEEAISYAWQTSGDIVGLQ
jgi:hypothetical protein